MTARQLALVVWSGAGLVFALFHSEIRGSLVNLVKAALHPKLLVPAIIGLGLNTSVVWGLRNLGLWTPDLWWDTGVFMLVGTVVLVSRAIGDKDYSWQYYLRILAETVGISALIGTVGSTYTFGIWLELALVPWLVMLGGMQVVSGADEKHAQVGKIVQFLIGATGLAMLARAVYGAIADYTSFLSIQTVRSLLLLFVLTLAYLPYLFLLRVWASYETAFIPLRLGEDKPLHIRLYARLRIIARHGLNLARLQRFRSGRGNDLRWATTRAAVDAVFVSASEA